MAGFYSAPTARLARRYRGRLLHRRSQRLAADGRIQQRRYRGVLTDEGKELARLSRERHRVRLFSALWA